MAYTKVKISASQWKMYVVVVSCGDCFDWMYKCWHQSDSGASRPMGPRSRATIASRYAFRRRLKTSLRTAMDSIWRPCGDSGAIYTDVPTFLLTHLTPRIIRDGY